MDIGADLQRAYDEGYERGKRESGWIPMAEQTPKKYENVIAANKRGKHYDIDKGWWTGYKAQFNRCGKGSYHNVTHWMPLPDPPKEK